MQCGWKGGGTCLAGEDARLSMGAGAVGLARAGSRGCSVGGRAEVRAWRARTPALHWRRGGRVGAGGITGMQCGWKGGGTSLAGEDARLSIGGWGGLLKVGRRGQLAWSCPDLFGSVAEVRPEPRLQRILTDRK